MIRTKLSRTILSVPPAVLLLFSTGCASKGYVQSQVDALRQENQEQHAAMQADLASLKNSNEDALARAQTAFDSSREARDLALGRAGFEELERFTVYFAFDSDALSDAGTSTLDNAVGGIGEHPEALVDVYGFADPTGPAAYNLELGQRRAEAVLRYLVARSPDALSRYAAVSFGEESLAAMTDGSGDAAQDRRVVVSLVRRVPLGGGESPTAENVSNR